MKKPAKKRAKKVIRRKLTRRNPGLTDFEINEAFEDLIYPHDGPVTNFVILSRATRFAHEKKHTPEALANAAYQAFDFRSGM